MSEPESPSVPKPQVYQLHDIDRLLKTRLSNNFILRDFMYSNQASLMGASNLPEDWDRVIESGKALCAKVLEPVLEKFGRFFITFGYQSREVIEACVKTKSPKSSNPHQWDRGTFGKQVYCRVDILPICVEDGEVSKLEFGEWLMMNLDIDLCMMWAKSNVFCITIGPKPRRVWLEWTPKGKGEGAGNCRFFMGEDYWQLIYPTLDAHERPKFAPSYTDGSMQWRCNR